MRYAILVLLIAAVLTCNDGCDKSRKAEVTKVEEDRHDDDYVSRNSEHHETEDATEVSTTHEKSSSEHESEGSSDEHVQVRRESNDHHEESHNKEESRRESSSDDEVDSEHGHDQEYRREGSAEKKSKDNKEKHSSHHSHEKRTSSHENSKESHDHEVKRREFREREDEHFQETRAHDKEDEKSKTIISRQYATARPMYTSVRTSTSSKGSKQGKSNIEVEPYSSDAMTRAINELASRTEALVAKTVYQSTARPVYTTTSRPIYTLNHDDSKAEINTVETFSSDDAEVESNTQNVENKVYQTARPVYTTTRPIYTTVAAPKVNTQWKVQSYANNDFAKTVEQPKQVVYQTTRPVYTTARPVYTTARPVYTATATSGGDSATATVTKSAPTVTVQPPKQVVYQTTRPVYTTTRPIYTTTRPVYTTTRPIYTTTDRPVYTAENNDAVTVTDTFESAPVAEVGPVPTPVKPSNRIVNPKSVQGSNKNTHTQKESSKNFAGEKQLTTIISRPTLLNVSVLRQQGEVPYVPTPADFTVEPPVKDARQYAEDHENDFVGFGNILTQVIVKESSNKKKKLTCGGCQ